MEAPSVPNSALTTDKPPRHRRWVPLSLRMFVFFLVIQGTVATWLGVRAHYQKLAISEIQRLGGNVIMRQGVPAWVQRGFGKSLSDLLAEVWQVDLSGTAASDSDLHHLKDLRGIEVLILDGTQVTGSGLRELQNLPDLRRLSLQETALTNGDLAHLKPMPGLRVLSLDRCSVTGSGLVHLKGLSGLVELSLDETEVNNAGLVDLKGLTSLRLLSLKKTFATEKGVAALKQAMPELTIKHLPPKRELAH